MQEVKEIHGTVHVPFIRMLEHFSTDGTYGWHEEFPPADFTRDVSVDMRLADAFRMLVYLENPKAQLWWIMHTLRKCDPSAFSIPQSYERVLYQWWIEIFYSAMGAVEIIKPVPARDGRSNAVWYPGWDDFSVGSD